MILKGLPESFKPFSIFITQSDETLSFAEFKTKLRSYESTESMHTAAADDNVMGARAHPSRAAPSGASARRTESGDIVCFRCGQRGHKVRDCQRGQQWYSQGENTARRGGWRQRQQDNARGVYEETDDSTFAFKLVTSEPGSCVTRKGLMVDTGATSHIITDLAKFKSFDDRFQSETHCVELADGTSCTGVAERRGDAEVCLQQGALPQCHTEAGAVHPLVSPRHLLRESCNFEWGNGDLQGRRRCIAVQRRYELPHS